VEKKKRKLREQLEVDGENIMDLIHRARELGGHLKGICGKLSKL